jgi:nucleoside 2-deoxyribosyltransferase
MVKRRRDLSGELPDALRYAQQGKGEQVRERDITEEEMEMEKITCPICGTPDIKIVWEKQGEETVGSIVHPVQIKTVFCPVCGIYSCRSEWLTDSGLLDHFQNWQDCETKPAGALDKKYSDADWPEKKALIRHHIWKDAPHPGPEQQAFLEKLEGLWRSAQHPTGTEPFRPLPITAKYVCEIRDMDFPTPMEQVDYLIRFLGDKTRRLGGTYFYLYCLISDKSIPAKKREALKNLLSATVSVDEQNLFSIYETAFKSNLVENHGNCISLTLQGWTKYEDLKKGRSDSSIVFLAMQFEETQKKFFTDKLAPCLKNLNLQLQTLPDFHAVENILDNKLRNAIRESRILICDLTHRNNGAYFEAGFAEGLRKPVIYVCEQGSFDEHEKNKGKDGDRSKRLHFDVEHQEIYLWKDGDDESIKKFQSDITAKIQTVLYVGA